RDQINDERTALKELFHVLLNAFANRYAKSKGINNSHLPLLFGGFYPKPLTQGENQGELGHCELVNKQIAVIRLNQLYLLNKLDLEKRSNAMIALNKIEN
ncbi:7662_t:CDS:2, partial [Gigaspora rosea]